MIIIDDYSTLIIIFKYLNTIKLHEKVSNEQNQIHFEFLDG